MIVHIDSYQVVFLTLVVLLGTLSQQHLSCQWSPPTVTPTVTVSGKALLCLNKVRFIDLTIAIILSALLRVRADGMISLWSQSLSLQNRYVKPYV